MFVVSKLNFETVCVWMSLQAVCVGFLWSIKGLWLKASTETYTETVIDTNLIFLDQSVYGNIYKCIYKYWLVFTTPPIRKR